MSKSTEQLADDLRKLVRDTYFDGLYISLPQLDASIDECARCPHLTEMPNGPTCRKQFSRFFKPDDCDCPDPDQGPEPRSISMFYGVGNACPDGRFPAKKFEEPDGKPE